MILDLQTIDFEGKDFHFDDKSDEMEGAFKDLIGNESFQVDLLVMPLGNTYQITGKLKSKYPETCSLCGYDINVPLKSSINEIIVIEKERPRNTQVSQSQQNFDGGPSVTYINSPQIDLKDFLHEMMASSFAQFPECEDQDLCKSRRHHVPDDDIQETPGHPGFAALKGFKSKH